MYRVGAPHLQVTVPVGNSASFEEMSQRRRAVCSTVSDFTRSIFELQTFRSADERVTARQTEPAGYNRF